MTKKGVNVSDVALVRSGPKHVQKFTTPRSSSSKRDESGHLPTTSRALVLRRNVRGSGQVLPVVTKISGREKLDLLAEDLTQRGRGALIRQFNLQECLKICESLATAFLDDIAQLKDSDLFHSTILTELKSRTTAGQEIDLSPSHVADVVATRVHNSFMLASAWNIAWNYLHGLDLDGLNDSNIQTQLANNLDFRERYLVVCHIIDEICNLSQSRVATLAMTTPHYASYFKKKPKSDQVEFEWQRLREAGRSFIDSIILELCFPQAPYSRAILFDILHDAIDESPRDAKRFPQLLFDAIGDLAVVVQIQQILDTPLSSPQGQQWKSQTTSLEYPEDFQHWLWAQDKSETATRNSELFKHLIYPLERTKSPDALTKMWTVIDLSYKKVAGVDIETLWQLPDAFASRPGWSAGYKPVDRSHEQHRKQYDSDDSGDKVPSSSHRPKQLPSSSSGGRKKTKRLALEDAGNDTDDSMPGLQSLSESESEDGDYSSSYNSLDDFDDNEDDESEYDSEYEDEMRDFYREAMDMVHEMDVLEGTSMDPLQQDGIKGNPFIKILGSLRGRLFSSNSKLKSGRQSAATNADKPTPEPKYKPPPKETPQSTPIPAAPPRGVTIVEEEEVTPPKPKKKKKKKSKQKKASELLESVAEVPSPQKSATATSPTMRFPPPTPAVSNIYGASHMSTSSLTSTTTAQSSRSYLQSEKLDHKQEKTKTRGLSGSPSVFSSNTTSSLFSRLTPKDKGKSTVEAEKKARRSWLNRLSKKAHDTMEQLFHLDGAKAGAKPMKWGHFIKLMAEMGFSIDPSTAGSSVRFDPPDPKDKPFMVHKPHPEPVFAPQAVRDIGKRLQRHYGWSKEDLAALKS